MKSHKSEVAITELLFAPTRKQCLCSKRHKQTKHLEHESKRKDSSTHHHNSSYLITTVTFCRGVGWGVEGSRLEA